MEKIITKENVDSFVKAIIGSDMPSKWAQIIAENFNAFVEGLPDVKKEV